jgi:hypothetical protein
MQEHGYYPLVVDHVLVSIHHDYYNNIEHVVTILLNLGLGVGLLKDGEVGISATNRNFKGRMGSPNASAYLASPGKISQSLSFSSLFFFELINVIIVISSF